MQVRGCRNWGNRTWVQWPEISSHIYAMQSMGTPIYFSQHTLYPVSIQQQKNSCFSLVAEIANISLANQVTQKSTSEFKTSEKNWELSHLRL
mgnify:CR=1 FL=1